MEQIKWIPGSFALPFPDDNYIAEYEQYWRVRLPDDFKLFLKRYGGGDPHYASFLAGGHEWAIDRFLCLLSNFKDNPLGWYDIDVVWSQIVDRLGEDPDALGAEMLPIVVLFAGDYVCLDYRASKESPREDPTVVVWLHEDSEYLSPATIPVADTFTEFLEMIQPYEKKPPEWYSEQQ